jgi:hypothetical protein
MELTVSDEANRCGIPVQVVQRPGGGIVLGVATSPVDAIPRQPPDHFPAPVQTLPGYTKENFMDCRNVLSRRVL